MHDNTIKQETFKAEGVCKVSEITAPKEEDLQMILSNNINYKGKAT